MSRQGGSGLVRERLSLSFVTRLNVSEWGVVRRKSVIKKRFPEIFFFDDEKDILDSFS